jgi:hypothetical protein
MLSITTLMFPACADLLLEEISREGQTLFLTVRSTRRALACPDCAQESMQVHSRYPRTLADVSLMDYAAVLRIQVRRFFCSNAACARKTFAEIRQANGGEFDVSAAVQTDPIGMLGNAFQFTIGRFRRFVRNMKRTIDPLEDVTQQEIELTDTFLANIRQVLRGSPSNLLSGENGQHAPDQEERALRFAQEEGESRSMLLAHVEQVRSQVQLIQREEVEQQGTVVRQLVERASRHCQQMAVVVRMQNARGIQGTPWDVQSLETLLRHLEGEVQSGQQHTMQRLAEVETTLDHLTTGIRTARISRAALQTAGSQVQEIAHLAEGFAQEVGMLAQHLRILTQEMRSSLAPFPMDGMLRTDEPRSPNSRPFMDATRTPSGGNSFA